MLGRSLDAMKSLPTRLLTLHIIAKFLFGVGLGMLLVHYYDVPVWTGRVLVVIAIVIAIPSTVRILSSLGKS